MNKIKLFFYLFFLTALVTNSSCNKIEDAIKFGFNMEDEFKLPPNIPVNTPFNIPGIAIPFDSDETFESNGTNADLIKEITLEYIKLTVTDPAGQDFTFLKDIELFFDKDGVGEKLIAWKYDVSDNIGQELALDVTTDALDNYLKSDGLKLKVSATTDKLVTKEITIHYDIRVNVKADVFK